MKTKVQRMQEKREIQESTVKNVKNEKSSENEAKIKWQTVRQKVTDILKSDQRNKIQFSIQTRNQNSGTHQTFETYCKQRSLK